jgi:YHS domain-containing protein
MTLSPLRLIILGILVYIAYRLIVGDWQKNKIAKEERKKKGGTMPLDDILEEDPVCGKLVPRKQAVTLRQSGKTRYFCSQECCDSYRKEQGERS